MKTLKKLFAGMLLAGSVMTAQAADDVVYVAVSKGSTVVDSPTKYADPSTDAYLTPSGTPGIYTGEVEIGQQKPFIFYKVSDDTNVWYGSENPYNAIERENIIDGVATINVEMGSKDSWYFKFLPENCDGTFEVSLDLNAGVATLTGVSMKAPEKLYIWGSENGPNVSFKNMATMLPSVSDPEIYEVVMDVPACGPFDKGDVETGAYEEGYGFYFQLSTNGESQSAGGSQILTVGSEQQIIEIPLPGDEYTATLLTDRSGGPMICMSPGKIRFACNWTTKEFSATMETADVIYVATNDKYYGTFPTSDNDPALTLNTETGWYEGAKIEVPAKGYAWKFYRKDENGEVEWIGPITAQVVNFSNSLVYTAILEEWGSSSWRLGSFNGDETSCEMSLAINPDTYEVRFEELNSIKKLPEAIYLWGGFKDNRPDNPGEDSGDIAYQVIGTLLPQEGDTGIYTLTVDVPESTADRSFLFVLSKNGTTVKKPAENFFGAWISTSETNETGLPPTVDFENDYTFDIQLYNATITPEGLPTSSIFDLYAGSTTFSFDYETLMLTLTYNINQGGPSNVVSELEETEGGITVVSLDGRVLLQEAEASALKGLQPGIYVVNGKKVLVK